MMHRLIILVLATLAVLAAAQNQTAEKAELADEQYRARQNYVQHQTDRARGLWGSEEEEEEEEEWFYGWSEEGEEEEDWYEEYSEEESGSEEEESGSEKYSEEESGSEKEESEEEEYRIRRLDDKPKNAGARKEPRSSARKSRVSGK